MEPLKNLKHEAFARAISAGQTLRRAARTLGYKSKWWADFHSCNLIRYPNVQERIQQLQAEAVNEKIMSVIGQKAADAALADIDFAFLQSNSKKALERVDRCLRSAYSNLRTYTMRAPFLTNRETDAALRRAFDRVTELRISTWLWSFFVEYEREAILLVSRGSGLENWPRALAKAKKLALDLR